MKILLVEGINDAKVVEALCKKSGLKGVYILPLKDEQGRKLKLIDSYNEKQQDLNENNKLFDFAIYPAGSDGELVKMIVPLLKSEESIHTLAFILDADKNKGKNNDINIKSRLQQIAHKFQKYPNYNEKFNKMNPDGLIIPKEEELPKIGLWLMPNNTEQGMLEDFLMEMVDFPNKCIKFAEDCVACAVDENCTSFKKPHFSKAVIHTYLSWQDEPGDALALSIKQEKLNVNSPIAKKFLNWLIKVFEIDIANRV
ncbi:MAG: hypothetical protein KAI79_08045 [Bacteroidales bacterium]|nr:hypothetical protein [Bacteroidales bacterium]